MGYTFEEMRSMQGKVVSRDATIHKLQEEISDYRRRMKLILKQAEELKTMYDL